MSFAVWRSEPPFAESDLNPGERIYRVGGFWVVTDQGEPTAEEVARALDPLSHNQKIDAQIMALEQSSGGYMRGLREFMLAQAAETKRLGGADFMANKGMQNVKALDDQIRALRAQRVP